MGDKELIWVPKDVADEYKKAESFEEQRKLVEEVIASKRREFKFSQEELDEDLLIFKAVCMRHKQALQEAYDEQAEALEKLWEESGDISSKISEHAKKLANEISPLRVEINRLREDVAAIKSLAANIEPYLSPDFLNVITAVSKMEEEAKELLKIILTKDKTAQ